MSFGFGVGDFLAVIKLASKIRKDFVDAPHQLSAICDEIRNLSFVLQDVDTDLSGKELNDQQQSELQEIASSSRNVLGELEKTAEKYKDMRSTTDRATAKGTLKYTWQRLKWEPNEIQELRLRITSNITLLNTFNGRVARDSIRKIAQRQDDKANEAILNWISDLDYGAQHTDCIARRQEGTGQWLLDSPEFKSWISGSRETLFCPGIPGAGKTILASVVIEELFSRHGSNGSVGIAYLYCNFNRRYGLNVMLESILKQLAQRQSVLPSVLSHLYKTHKSIGSRPSVDELSTAIHSLLAKSSLFSQSFLVIDGLDECQTSGGSRSRLLDIIFHLQESSNVNVLATSRFIPEITQRFESMPILEIRASKDDVARYLQGNLASLPSFVTRRQDLQEEILDVILSAIDGMFLLAHLYLISLIGKKSPKAIRSALKNLSTNEKYEHAYNGLMERIQGQLSDQSQLAMQVLAWITCAQRPLTTIELQTALAVEIGESEFDEDNLPDLADMVSVCAGLVTVDEQSNIIRLVHYTTQEYLERTQCVWFPEAHCDIGTSCVAYLLLDVFKEGQCRTYEGLKARFRNYPLFEYAGLFWGDHVRLYIGSNERYPSEQMAIELLGDIPRANSCMQTIIGKGFDGGFGLPIRRLKGHRGIYPRYGNTYPESTSQFTVGLHLAVYFELPQVLQTFISRGEPVDTQNACLNTPLSWAAYLGLEEIVSLLLKNGANPNAKDKMGWTPIHLAAEGGFKRVVEMLLDEDGDPMLISASGITPLHISAVYGDTSVARILLKSDMDPHLRDHAGRTSLGFASWRGYTELIELLLDCSPNVKLGSILDSSISTAAEGGHVEAMKLLLNRGADPNTTIPSELFNFWEPSGHTPIMQAAKSGMEEAVKLLLEWGVNLNLKDNRGRTALSLSIHREHADIALHLLSKGADPNSLDNSGRTALFYAPYSTSVAMVSLLTPYIEHPNQTDRYGRTPLHVAVARGNLRVVHDLLDLNGIDSEIQDIFGRTPLSDAILRQKVDVVNVLESFASGVTYEKPNSQPNEANEQATAAQSCDVCMVDIFDGHTIHYCSLCEIGCFYICELCHQAGARCHNVKHVLEKRIEDEYEVLL